MTDRASAPASVPEIAAALAEARERTLALVACLDDRDLVRVHSPLMSPLVWDLAHIAAFEDLWLVHRFGGRALLRGDLAEVYDAFETPRARRGDLPLLGPAAAREYLAAVRERTLEELEARGAGDGQLHEMVLRHEHQHNETMLQTLQLAELDTYRLPGRLPPAAGGAERFSGLEFVEVPGGECTIGAPAGGFAYDNERPRHRVDVPGHALARTPVTNSSYLSFIEAGGYERREWWSDDGWAWKQQHGITRPAGWSAGLDTERRLDRVVELNGQHPVVHVSWFEADAFARAHEARLPSEAEWEKAASWDAASGRARRYPWGGEPPVPGHHANLDHRAGGPAPVGAHPAGASPCGCLGMIGDVWEWTSSPFSAYPGFRAHPYREYSEPFFGDAHRVLRGGAWATRARVISASFRNWDYPQRRQIFAGFRLARDL
ncbi:MAG TPA: ergothioneine biosynthesis protein EgtB [Solirubrobacteraceae bacterium]|nr:ergothioneine biosynthesis protein EgtB [Solirubrobacteraceae bacterium]